LFAAATISTVAWLVAGLPSAKPFKLNQAAKREIADASANLVVISEL
jgi:hypothetical protein